MESNDEQFNNKFLRAFNKTSKKIYKILIEPAEEQEKYHFNCQRSKEKKKL